MMSQWNHKRPRPESAERTPPAPDHPHLPFDWAQVHVRVGEEYPVEYRDYLACPFPKHNPYKYRWVKGSCTEGWGFNGIGKLKEHINRVHSRKFGCDTCSHRFEVTQNNSKLEKLRKDHKCERSSQNEDLVPEVMTSQQQDAWASVDCRIGGGRDNEHKWKVMIYRPLFPDTPAGGEPDPYHRPGLCSIETVSRIVTDLAASSPPYADTSQSYGYQPYNAFQSYPGEVLNNSFVTQQPAVNEWGSMANVPNATEGGSSQPAPTYAQVVQQGTRTRSPHMSRTRLRSHQQNMAATQIGMAFTAQPQSMSVPHMPGNSLSGPPVISDQPNPQLSVPYSIRKGPASGFDSGCFSEEDQEALPIPPYYAQRFSGGEEDDYNNSDTRGNILGFNSAATVDEQALHELPYQVAFTDDLEVSEDEE